MRAKRVIGDWLQCAVNQGALLPDTMQSIVVLTWPRR